MGDQNEQSQHGAPNGQENLEQRFLAAYDEYADALFRHAQLRISNRERAVDIVHDTFTKVWSYVRQGTDVKTFRPFLYKVLNNLIIDEYRKKKTESLDALLEQDGVDEGNFAELAGSDVATLEAQLDGERAFALLHELPDVYREVIVLRYADGLGPREIATLIEESDNVVSVRLHRGLKLLRDKVLAQDELAAERRRATERRTDHAA